jgi:hypothetical protein
MPEQIHGLAWFAGLREGDDGSDITDVVGDLLHVEAFTVRAPAASKIQGIHGQADGGELLRD